MNDNSSKLFKAKNHLLNWANRFDVFTLLDSNNFPRIHSDDAFGEFELLIAAGVRSDITEQNPPFKEIEKFVANKYAFGFLTYDLKNRIERLKSENPDSLHFPEYYFFEPLHIIVVTKEGDLRIIKTSGETDIATEINAAVTHQTIRENVSVKSRISEAEYLATVSKIKEHIIRGDIYEMNFCQEFYATDADINPITTYVDLTKLSPTPFACFFKYHNKYLLSATPERFLKRIGNKVISQPIKGTIKRGKTKEEDKLMKTALQNDPKEIAENVMIVDLVRNDLSRIAKDGSVMVTEMFGIYPFKQVYQMISTIEAEIGCGFTSTDVIKETFPMGSMTGAPKVSAMKLIEKYESSKRGLYSGAVGFFTPNGDFDFNVIIRSILYNSENRYLSYTVGSAITSNSIPEKEYEECIVKAKAINEVLKGISNKN